MARTDRLFRLLQAIRTLPRPVTAARLATETGVSERTLYRDIETLRAGGALIDGAPGLGYSLTEDPALPPQTFTQLEIEALVIGIGEVRMTGDGALAQAADNALAKIVATLPERLQRQAVHAVSQVYHYQRREADEGHMAVLREATWQERAVDLTYEDRDGKPSERRVLPLSIVFLERSLMLLAWCQLRQDFRKFLVSRIVEVQATEESFRPRRVPLLRDFIKALTGSQRAELRKGPSGD
jgi:predicted DNA-binding transcriptional regulator YafY